MRAELGEGLEASPNGNFPGDQAVMIDLDGTLLEPRRAISLPPPTNDLLRGIG